ncbi:DUF397 domain-containing protein [Nocardia sp. NPDC003345]
MSVDPDPARWFKSTYSQGDGECVEVAFLAPGLVGVRDSKRPEAGVLHFASGDWEAFTSGISHGHPSFR